MRETFSLRCHHFCDGSGGSGLHLQLLGRAPGRDTSLSLKNMWGLLVFMDAFPEVLGYSSVTLAFISNFTFSLGTLKHQATEGIPDL